MAGVIGRRLDGSEQAVPHSIDEAAHRNLSLVLVENEWLNSVSRQAFVAGTSIAPTGKKYRRLAIIADRISEAVTPHSACRRGCSHCCHIAVVVSEFEAKAIGKEIGVEARFRGDESSAEAALEKYKGVPCTFLVAGRCSIYEHRPLACRVHFNLADTEDMCDLEVPTDQSVVPNLNLTEFWLGAALAFSAHRYGDIRDFFAREDSAGRTRPDHGANA